ncbi:MAG TPA: hypothetical protein VJR05_12590 [Acidimicrobiia bacterium]|nr:hypothetical protein [Acidimicrobiia bacterium]
MARYLVVAHQTADSPELAGALRQIKTGDPEASFVLVVPATPVQHLRGWTEGEAKAVASEAGMRAEKELARHGIELAGVRVGDPDPVNAAYDEWNDHPDYQHVVISTLPQGVSRWLNADVGKRLERRLGLPVTHVVAR